MHGERSCVEGEHVNVYLSQRTSVFILTVKSAVVGLRKDHGFTSNNVRIGGGS